MLPRLRLNQRSTLLSLSLKGAHAEDKWLTEVEICAGGRLRAAVALTTKGSGGEMWLHITSQASEAVLPFCVQTCDVLTAGGLSQVPEPQAEIGSVMDRQRRN